jgi:hypothetical protein
VVILKLERAVKVDELFASFEALIEADRPGRDDLVYLERRGDEYDWWIVGPEGAVADPRTPDQPAPDAWMSFLAAWPTNPDRLRAFFDDLLAELDSMAARADRCRWPVDEPWPHFH